MPKSTLTRKYQTTVPRAIREHLGLAPNDALSWEIRDDGVAVLAASTAFLKHRGTVRIGKGSIAEDLRRARAERGRTIS
jgi:AbrB family looped-hinge helix DNA binding protein